MNTETRALLMSLLDVPERVDGVSAEQVPVLIGHLVGLEEALKARLLIPRGDGEVAGGAREAQDTGRLMSAHEAAQVLGVSTSWLYRRARSLPFTVRLPGRGIRFSYTGVRKYIDAKHR